MLNGAQGEIVTVENVSVITVSFRTGPVLERCIHSFLAASDVLEVIIVDNGNPEPERETLERIAASDSRVLLVRPGRNLGFASACNLGASKASGTFLAFANPDLEIPPGTFGTVRSAFGQHPDAWICGGHLLGPDGREQQGGRREVYTPWRSLVELLRLDRLFPSHPYFRRLHLLDEEPILKVAEVPTVSGAFMVLPRDAFYRLGGWDDRFFLHMEDVDLCLRTLKMGGKVLYCGPAPVHHHGSTSDVSGIFVEWHKTVSTGYYFRKHFMGPYPAWALALVSLALWMRFVVRSAVLLSDDTRRLIRRMRR